MSDDTMTTEEPAAPSTPTSALAIPLSQELKNQKGMEPTLDEKSTAMLIGNLLWERSAPEKDQLTFWDGLTAGPRLLVGDELTEDETPTQARRRAAMAAMVTDLVMASVPTEYRTEAILSAVDLRPYIARVQANPEVARAEGLGNKSAGLSDFPDLYADEVMAELDRVDTKITGDALIQRYTAGEIATMREQSGETPLTDTELNNITNFDVDAAGMNTAARIGMAQVGASQGMTVEEQRGLATGGLDMDSLFGDAETALDAPVLSRSEIQQFARLGLTDITTMVEEEASILASEGTNATVYQFETGALRGGGPRRGPVNDQMNARQARDYLHTLNDAEFERMQERLAQAGYYELIGKDPEYGWQDDQATDEAWALALTNSVKRGISVPQLLGAQAQEQQARRQDRMRQFSVPDTRVAANQLAIGAIGRNLTRDEHDAVEEFLRGLQDERRPMIAGTRTADMSWQREGMNMNRGFDDVDMQAAVESVVSPQAAGDNMFDSMQSLNNGLGIVSNRPNDPQRGDT